MLILPISVVAESLYCPRNAWYAFVGERRNMASSVDFIKAIHAHKHRDELSVRSCSGGCKQINSMSLYHQNLGLSGKADMVEWRNNIPIPVETKTGKFRTFPNYEIQVCLQALCLEDMFWCTVPYGEIFFTGSMRRKKIILDSGIREKSSEIVLSLRNAFLSYDIRRFQRANDVRCHACMYNESCLPEISQ